MKVLLLLVVALVAVAHARHYSAEAEAESGYQSAETREAASSERRYHPAAAARSRSNDDDGDDSSDSSDSQEWTTTTEMPCPQVCPLIYQPVCVRDSEGVYRKFSNECMLLKCRCETDMEYEIVSMKKCRGNHVPECPRPSTPSRRSQPEEDLDVADSSASE